MRRRLFESTPPDWDDIDALTDKAVAALEHATDTLMMTLENFQSRDASRAKYNALLTLRALEKATYQWEKVSDALQKF